jgi:hypothetical protein
MGLKLLPYWPFKRKKRQFYFVDSDGKQLRCRQSRLMYPFKFLYKVLHIIFSKIVR